MTDSQPNPAPSPFDRAPDVFAADCPSRIILTHITSRWGGLILICLRGKTLRFSEIRRIINGVSERMLAQTLTTLVQDGFVLRKSYDVVPPHVEYSLTPLGTEASLRLEDLARGIEGNMPAIMAHQAEQAA
jgi:DNA-binding HxlR family transcriptional regulator